MRMQNGKGVAIIQSLEDQMPVVEDDILPAWGKFDQTDGSFHRLEHHCADVAACFELLLEQPNIRRGVIHTAGIKEICETTKERLLVLAFLHDLGKLNSGFQFKVRASMKGNLKPPRMGHVEESALICGQPRFVDALGLHAIVDWGEAVEPLLFASWSHHGRPMTEAKNTHRSPAIWQAFGNYDPVCAAKDLGDAMRRWYPQAFEAGPPLPSSPPFAHFFAGLVALADQLGSAKEFFEFEAYRDIDYVDTARQRAKSLLEQRKLIREEFRARSNPVGFEEIFEVEPRPIQKAVSKAHLDTQLLILESETGSGKTEAAIMRFVRLWQSGRVDGLYFALPTRAAAKQIHGRVDLALKKLFPAESALDTVLAIPGYLRVGSEEKVGRAIENFQVYWEDKPDEQERQARWAAESARHYLSAAAAVGTLDQTLLGALRVKWAHLRHASLARSLLVVDEVHSSDPYMTELLRTLLEGHLQAGGYAMLMSATLAAEVRAQFCRPRSSDFDTLDENVDQACAASYPALTEVYGRDIVTKPIGFTGYKKEVSVCLKPWMNNASDVASYAIAYARRGVAVLVIRNTVAAAQQVFDAVADQDAEELLLRVNGVSTLHHSRFAVEDRRLLDDKVEEVMGTKRQSLQRGNIVIGTQTLEQSLDIDADILITDLCPMDVLLQRIGRLHRHPQNLRPRVCKEASCIILTPSDGLEIGLNGSLMKYGLGTSEQGDGGIYRNLLHTQLTQQIIQQHPLWKIPEMNRFLVEHATHSSIVRDRVKELGEGWEKHQQQILGRGCAEVSAAKAFSLDRACDFDSRIEFPQDDGHIRTRLGEDGPRIELDASIIGPFGNDVRTFNIPAHLFRNRLPSKDDIENATVQRDSNGVSLSVGQTCFTYSASGLFRAEG